MNIVCTPALRQDCGTSSARFHNRRHPSPFEQVGSPRADLRGCGRCGRFRCSERRGEPACEAPAGGCENPESGTMSCPQPRIGPGRRRRRPAGTGNMFQSFQILGRSDFVVGAQFEGAFRSATSDRFARPPSQAVFRTTHSHAVAERNSPPVHPRALGINHRKSGGGGGCEDRFYLNDRRFYG